MVSLMSVFDLTVMVTDTFCTFNTSILCESGWFVHIREIFGIKTFICDLQRCGFRQMEDALVSQREKSLAQIKSVTTEV